MTEDIPCGEGYFSATVSFHPDPLFREGRVVAIETFITKRAKSGTELEEHQHDLGVAISKLMQGE